MENADAALVERTLSGDLEGFGELHRRYYPKVVTLVSAILRDRVRAEDLVQDAYVSALRDLPQLKDRDRFYPWIRRIAVNRALDEKRRWALETLFGASGVSISVLLAGLDSLSSHLGTVAGPRALARALTSNASTSVELRAIEIGAPLVSNPDVRRALVRCLASGHATSVVLAALKALDGRVASDLEVKDAFTRVLENDEMSSAARVRAGASLLPAADAALSARIADAMEEVVAKARRHGGNREVVERALSILESIDRDRAERLRARGDGKARGSAALTPGLYPSPAL